MMVDIPRATQAHQLTLAPSLITPSGRTRKDWALGLPSRDFVHRLQQGFYLFVRRMVCFREGDEKTRRMWLRTPVSHLLARYENEASSTGGIYNQQAFQMVGMDWQ